ncbi:MAG: SDR family oxidoreductase [Myxococcota bacterium]
MAAILAGRHALVGGASQGIGRAIAIALAERGARVSLLARSRDALIEVAQECIVAGAPDAHVLVADLDDRDALASQMQRHLRETGPVQVWIHNTGGPPAGSLLHAPPEDLAHSLQRHLIAGQQMLQALISGMEEAGWGRIITITSTSVKEPLPKLGVSNLTRSAVHSWMKSLSHELPPGITINNVCPGFTDTPRLRSLARHTADAQSMDIEQVWADWAESTPVGRIAGPEEIAEVVAFLCSPAAGYVDGVAIPVDGGRTRAL